MMSGYNQGWEGGPLEREQSRGELGVPERDTWLLKRSRGRVGLSRLEQGGLLVEDRLTRRVPELPGIHLHFSLLCPSLPSADI